MRVSRDVIAPPDGEMPPGPRPTLATPALELAAEVREGLLDPALKHLPASLLYDDVGSALFDAICLLPEYGLTRADERILKRHAPEIFERVHGVERVVELGSGSGRKTRPVLEALAAAGGIERTYLPIDISRAALARCVHDLDGVPGVRVEPIEGDYLSGLRHAATERRDGEPILVLFLGSTIGNFERDAAERFVEEVRETLRPGDALLLGTDLLKPVPRMLAAYDDALGVTAAFNLNVLTRLNREFGAEFEPARFRHHVRWDPEHRRVEMHLIARRSQTIPIPGLGIDVAFRVLESIWTESSHKFAAEEPRAIAARNGFTCVEQWFDDEWAFAESLLIAK